MIRPIITPLITRRQTLTGMLAFSALPVLPQAQTRPQGTILSTNPTALTLTGSTATASTLPLGIILVGASWCPWCHAAARELHLAAGQWGWPVLIAAIDAQPIAPFESFIDAKDHPLTAQINRLPTTLIVEPKTDTILSAFEGFKGAVPYLSRIANTFEAYDRETAHG